MIDEILRNNLVIREWVNGGLLPLNTSLVIVIGLFLWDKAIEAMLWRRQSFPGVEWVDLHRTWSQFQETEGVQTACALFWIFLADALRAGAAWSILNYRIAVSVPEDPANVVATVHLVNLAFIVAGIIGLLASLRCIYLFTPIRWGHWYWIGSVALTLMFQIVT